MEDMTTNGLPGIEASRQPVVRIQDGEVWADSRDVADLFGKEHRRVLQTIRELSCSDDFRRHNFVLFKINDLTGEHTSHVTMTKDGFTFLAMGFIGQKAAVFKERYIAQFNAMEAELRRRAAATPALDVRDPRQLAQVAIQLIEVVREKDQVIAELGPKAEALDRIATADGSLNITEAAKALQVRPKDLFSYLSAHSWIYRRPGAEHWLGYQNRVQSGDLEHKVTTVLRADGREKVTEQVRMTPKGLAKIAKLFPPAATPA